MKVYRVNYGGPDGVLVSWHSSKRQAEHHSRTWVHDEGDAAGLTVLSIQPIDVPTDRAGLVRWLNSRFNTDNG